MSFTIEAIYENGVLKPAKPLPLEEHQKVQVTVEPEISPILKAYGILGFKGTAEEAEYFAMSPDLDPLEDS